MSTYLGNLGGTFSSDVASATRIATSAPFARYLAEQIFERSLFIRSGILRQDARLSNFGPRFEAPFFDPINSFEEVVESNGTWGNDAAGAPTNAGYFQTQKITADTQYATHTRRGFMFGCDLVSRLDIGEDPLAHFGDQLADDLARHKTAKLVSHLQGLFAAGGPLAAHVNDISVTTGAGAANYMSASTITGAKNVLGERGSALTTIAMHSAVANYLSDIGMLTFSTDALVAGGNVQWGGGGVGVRNTDIGYFAGLRVVVDDQMPIEGASTQQGQYVSYAFGPGAVMEGNQMPINIRVGENLPSLQDLVRVFYAHVFHVPGTSWADASNNPTNVALSTGTNWGLAYTNPKLIPIVKIVCNTPYGITIP